MLGQTHEISSEIILLQQYMAIDNSMQMLHDGMGIHAIDESIYEKPDTATRKPS